MKLFAVLTTTLLIGTVLSRPKKEFIQSTHTFTSKLYKQLIDDKPNQNIGFSPIAIQTILSLLSVLINKNHLVVTEILDAANLPRTEQDRRRAFKIALESLNRPDNDFKAFDATKMYFGQGYSVKSLYRDIAKYIYNAEIETVSFDDPSTCDTINQWIAKKTNNKILNVLDSNYLSANKQMVLFSTLYLMGKWEKPFQQKENIFKRFNTPNSNKEVEMMTSFHTYDYAEDTIAQYLKLEMIREEGGAEMVFVLPKNRNDLLTLESNIDHILQRTSFGPANVNVTLPKFSITTDMKLKKPLQNLGVRLLFEWQTELEGLNHPERPYVTINDVLQKAYIDVNELGVGGALTGEELYGWDDTCVKPKVFTADHPFFYYVTVDKMVVFAGRVMQI